MDESIDLSAPRSQSPQMQHVSFQQPGPDESTANDTPPKKPKRTNTYTLREKAMEKGGRKPPYIPPKDQKLLNDGSISDFYVFMPYIHFETFKEMTEMTSSYVTSSLNPGSVPLRPQPSQRVEEADPNKNLRSEEEEALLKELALFRAYLDNSEQPLHIRRTLDQSFYHHVDTKHRDTDQVIHRFQKEIQRCVDLDIEPKVLMVDQLWMWVIGKKLVVTSFPQRWRHPRKDPLNVLESMLAIINAGSRDRVRTAYELALIIAGRCYGAYDRHGVGSDDPQFLDMFEGWIGSVMDDEVKLFQLFKEDSKDASEWIRNPFPLRSVHRKKRKEGVTTTEAGLEQGRINPDTGQVIKFSVLQEPDGSKIPPSGPDFIQNLLDVGRETRLLGEIKDIRDELGMLSLVFEQQEMVREGIKQTMEALVQQNLYKEKEDRRMTVVKRKLQQALEDHRKTITLPQRDIDRMERQAKRIYSSIRDLLDLKQKHANAIEARYAREQTDDTSRQGQTRKHSVGYNIDLRRWLTIRTNAFSDGVHDRNSYLSPAFIYRRILRH